MTNAQIKKQVEIALRRFSPVEVRVHRSSPSSDLVSILMVSDKFEKVGVYDRILTCNRLIEKQSEELASQYIFIVEPVTQAEFKTRNAPWPE